jgi:hypothetical protein
MRTVRSARGLLLAGAALALAVASVTMGEAPAEPLAGHSTPGGLERRVGGTITAADLADVATTSVLAGHLNVQPRLGPLWALPGLAAALAAVCLLRRLRSSPVAPARRVLLRDSVSRRAPPLAAFA